MVLTEEGLVVNTRKPKYIFGKHDLIQFHTTFWTKDDTSFVYPRNKIQIPFIILSMFSAGLEQGLELFSRVLIIKLKEAFATR